MLCTARPTGSEILLSAFPDIYPEMLPKPYKTKPFANSTVRIPALVPRAAVAEGGGNHRSRRGNPCKTNGRPWFPVSDDGLSQSRGVLKFLPSAFPDDYAKKLRKPYKTKTFRIV